MAHFPDLQPCTYFPFRAESLLAIGWLEAEHPYASGDVHHAFVEKLAELLVNPWSPTASGGPHFCTLCRFSGGPGSVSIEKLLIQIGVTNLFVPSGDRVYVAPSMILHYIDSHQYAPPGDFVEAVMRCPTMRSMEYLRQMARLLPRLSRSDQSPTHSAWT